MRSEIDVLESKNGPKTELEVEKTKFGRHAEFIGPANQNQGSGLTKTDENRRKSRQKGDWKTTLHLEAFFCRFFGISADFGRFWGLLGGPWGGILVVFWMANSGRIFGRIFGRRSVTTAVAAVRHLWLALVWREGIQQALAQGAGGLSRQSRGHRPPPS